MTITVAITHSQSVQDFLKAVYTLQQRMERVTTNSLAEVLSIKSSSVSDMAQRLYTAGLLNYEKYHGMRLTESGEQSALRLIRRHRLIELYLATDLGYQLHEVHHEAKRLEHAVSDSFIERLTQKLGNPTLDPYGDIIPGSDGTVPYRELQPLATLLLNIKAVIACLGTENPEMLQHLVGRGFALGSEIEILSRDPFEGPITLRLNNQTSIVGFHAASCILVQVSDS